MTESTASACGDCEGDAPVDDVGEDARQRRGEGRAEGDGGHEVGQRRLSVVLVDGVADVGERGRDDGAVERTAERAGDDEDRQGRGEGRDDADDRGGDEGQSHESDPAHPVGEYAPDRLADAVGEEVGTRDDQGLGEGDAEIGGHEHERPG